MSIRIIDLKQPAIVAAALTLQPGEMVGLATVPQGSTFEVVDGLLMIRDPSEEISVTIDIG